MQVRTDLEERRARIGPHHPLIAARGIRRGTLSASAKRGFASIPGRAVDTGTV